MSKSIPALTGSSWYQHRASKRRGKFRISDKRMREKRTESTISELLMPFLYSKEEIESANFEEMFKFLNSTRRSSEFRRNFLDYIYGSEVGNFGLDYHADFADGWRFVFGNGEEVEDEYGIVQEDESSNISALEEETVALVTKRMEEAREE
ncbi:uncharacterized protein EAE98_006914 [Botrytis deweyae]|uniref:RGS domain-containing protein n=1 Tax=Botrytis deweyae TaxID=2478750 RepID=A0ABQ7IJ29_9HELO|nr:uncharacterized protein EAE98_006914 [Botrytis deweyae]KAF7925689.1 hypothetical protein EAE98_006914 [Botrytis deweyae]